MGASPFLLTPDWKVYDPMRCITTTCGSTQSAVAQALQSWVL